MSPPQVRSRPPVPPAPGTSAADPGGATALLLAGTLALALALPAPGRAQGGETGFSAPGPRADHPYAELTRGLASTLARAYDRAVFAPGAVEITSDDCRESTVRHELRTEGGTPRAEVVMCRGLVDAVRAEMDSADAGSGVRDTVLAAALGLAYAHEIGHALSEMPGSGRTVGGEPYATEFTALTYVSRPRLAHWAAVYWAREPDRLSGAARRLAASLPPDRPEYGREHGFISRRMADLLCWSYGADPEGRGWILEESVLTREGAGRCRGEYRRLTERWGSLLRAPVRLGSTGDALEPPAGEGGTEGGEDTDRERPRGAGTDTTAAGEEPAPWGEAEALWSSYRARVGDVVAPLLADIIRARSGLPGEVIVTFEPSPGTLDLEIYGGPRSPEEARRVVQDYWEFVREEFGPYLERRFGPDLRRRDIRILYYDASGDEPRMVVGLLRGEWARP